MTKGPRTIPPDHALPWKAVAARLAVDPVHGLDMAEAARRQHQYGKNALRHSQGPGTIRRLAGQFLDPLVLLLLAAGTASLWLGHALDAGVIFAVVVVNAGLGFAQEAKAVAALDALSRSLVAVATVRRQGAFLVVPAEELVPGDVVRLEAGDRVPADMRLVAAAALRLDESALTGEAVPVDKTTAPVAARTPLGDRSCLTFATTVVTAGVGLGLVIATGYDAAIGRIATLTATADSLATPLTKALARFSKRLLVAILLLAGLGFAVGVARGEAPQAMFMAAVALAVGAIPEGLPAAVTVILAMGVSRMAARKAIIRHLPAVETLGSTTVVCSDKTGTLTQNRMTVLEIFAGDTTWRLAGEAFVPVGDTPRPGMAASALEAILKAAVLCNDARNANNGNGFTGDPTETALLDAAVRIGIDPRALRAARPRLAEKPFDAAAMFMATLHRMPDDGPPTLCLKGAIEAILPRCRGLGPDRPQAAALQRQVEAMGGRGLRVLAVAAKALAPGTTGLAATDLEGDATFLGLLAMLDPPRPEAAAAVAVCRRAGIMVKMITGDHAATAAAIAARLRLGGSAAITAMTGTAIDAAAPEALPRLAEKAHVFARVSPEQKLRLVRALQSLGHVTAMTGDGVNDAPALKQADIGVAMGQAGTEAAKEAADMVLADDNFATIAAAVEEGRGVFDNLLKFLIWTLPTNLGEGLVILAAVLFGAPLPMLPIQILWINMTTAGSLGLMLAFEPREAGVMERPPRDPHRHLLAPALVRRVVLFSLLLLTAAFGLHAWELAAGGGQAQARTVAVNVFAAMGAAYLLNCRSLRRPALSLSLRANPAVLWGIGTALVLQLALTYVPALNDVFATAPIGPTAWLRVCGAAVAAFGIMEAEKRLAGRQ